MPGVRTFVKSSLVIALLVAAGCGKKGSPLDQIGAAIAPPPPFDTLKLGMSVDEAKTALPALTGESKGAGYTELVVEKVPVSVVFEHSRLVHISLDLDRPSFEAELVKRWGPSQLKYPGQERWKGVVQWNGPVWRANHSCTKDGSACSVIFERPARPLTPAFFGKVPQPPGALAKLRPGMPIAEAKAIAPQLLAPFETFDMDLGVDDVEAAVFASDRNGVTLVGMDLITDKALETLRSAWGPEKAVTTRDHGVRPCWQGDPWRACITGQGSPLTKIEFERFLPLAPLLGEGPDIAYFAGVLGATRADVEAKYGAFGKPAHCYNCPRLVLPDTDFGKMFLDVHVSDAGKVEQYDLYLDYGGERVRAKLFALLAAKWGAKAKMPSDIADEKPIVLRAKAPHVTITDIKHDSDQPFMWRISVTP